MHTDEAGAALNTVYALSYHTGETKIVRRWAPVYVLQIARWLAFTLYDLSHAGAYEHRIGALVGLHEHFVAFMNDDRVLKSRRVWTQHGVG